jgi:CheY-like chemotaxis protein
MRGEACKVFSGIKPGFSFAYRDVEAEFRKFSVIERLYSASDLIEGAMVIRGEGLGVAGQADPRVHILLVEDNPGDVRLIQEALKTTELQYVLDVAMDGDEALSRLLDRSKNLPLPDLIILDLNLPRLSGHDVLTAIKDSPRTRTVPVIVLSSSGLLDDIQKAYGAHANCYIQKPQNIDDFFHVCSLLEAFWFEVARLPKAIHPVV